MKKTAMPKAINYLLAREKELRECFQHAPSRIENNLAENALRPIKLGGKFCANFYSVVSNAGNDTVLHDSDKIRGGGPKPAALVVRKKHNLVRSF